MQKCMQDDNRMPEEAELQDMDPQMPEEAELQDMDPRMPEEAELQDMDPQMLEEAERQTWQEAKMQEAERQMLLQEVLQEPAQEGLSFSAWLKRFCYYALQLTWGSLQNLAGLCIYLANRDAIHYRYKEACVTVWNRPDSMGCGMFIFIGPESMDSEDMLHHEFGHTIQSVILGPFWGLLIALPSVIWNRRIYPARHSTDRVSYYSFYPERWADKLGGVRRTL